MKVRFIEYQGSIFIVIGISYDINYTPPDVFHCIRLEGNIIRTMILSEDILIIPIVEVEEITDKIRIRTIWTLFGS